MQAEPFEIAIPEEKLHDLRDRLERINWAPDFANDGWAYGVERRATCASSRITGCTATTGARTRRR